MSAKENAMTPSNNRAWLGCIGIGTALAVLALSVSLPAPAAADWWSAVDAPRGKSAPATPIDLNTASEKDLVTLPGVGPATAKKIVAGRPYARVADLARAGVPAKTIHDIAPLVTVGGGGAAEAASPGAAAQAAPDPASSTATGAGPPIRGAAGPRTGRSAASSSSLSVPPPSPTVDLNHASQKELETLPGVDPATASRIVAARPYSMVEELTRAGLSAVKIAKLAPLARVGPAMPPPTPAGAPVAGIGVPATAGPSPIPAAATPPPATAGNRAPAPPEPGMVWVNLDTKIFHLPGDRWYGKTKHGQYMTEADAVKAGYRATRKGPKAPSQ
jgi:DNA uptake protein ComE-like DNA-binding protein